MSPHFHRKQLFTCPGCGQRKTASLNVPREQANDPIAPPHGWLATSLTAQHPEYGAIVSISLFVCNTECGEKVAAGEGVGKKFIEDFKAFFIKPNAKPLVEEKPKLGDIFDKPEVTP